MTSSGRSWRMDWPVSLKEAGLLTLVSVLATVGLWAGRGENRLPLAADPAVYELELAAPLVDVAAAQELEARYVSPEGGPPDWHAQVTERFQRQAQPSFTYEIRLEAE